MNIFKRLLIPGLLVVICLAIAYVLWSFLPSKPSPQRAGSLAESTQAIQNAQQLQETIVAEAPLVIEATDILNVSIPAVAIDAKVSGETWPRESPRCHGGVTCIDPPLLKEAAWYGAFGLPSVPSEDTVLIFGHSNWNNTDQQVFNNLPAVIAGDAVIVTTQNAVFTYRANTPALVAYEEMPNSTLVYDSVPNRVVMVSCNSKESAASVVTADLISAVPR